MELGAWGHGFIIGMMGGVLIGAVGFILVAVVSDAVFGHEEDDE